MRFTTDELLAIHEALRRRTESLRKAVTQCAGSLYPSIYERRADECEAIRARIEKAIDRQRTNERPAPAR